jgi:hypothetical protein
MKKISYLILFMLFAVKSNLYCQEFPLDSKTNLYTFTDVVIVKDSVSKDELFNRSKNCFVSLFKNSQKVIQEENRENGVIVGKGNIKVYAKALGMTAPAGYVNFTISLYVKNGRYKYIISNFIHEGSGSNMPSVGNLENEKPGSFSWTNKQWNDVKNQVYNEIDNIIVTIKLEMNKKSEIKNDW